MSYLRILMVGLRGFFSLSPRTCFAAVAIVVLTMIGAAPVAAAERPNILWITCEDMSADLGCYGDVYARSPNIDRFATEGVRFTRCFSHAGVCAPSRSGLITGMYPCSIGSHNMRSRITLPPDVKCFPEYLRAAGYYCTNNAKTDYNFETPKEAWDANGKDAHWRNRAKDQPFFAVFNLQVTHESQIRAPEDVYRKNTARLTAEQRHDPAKAKLPPYYPDTPAVRRDWARYHDNITAMDYQFADHLRELEEAGLADDTIVFFYSDHGRGLPRAKRWLYDSGTHVPLIVRWPAKLRTAATKSDSLKPGVTNDELVAFVDLAPTVLSIAGVEIPTHLQGKAFLGAAQAEKPREYVYGARDRMDERVDFIRSVRDKRFKYLRNYEWWKPYAQNINYMNEMPTMKELRRLAANGKLNGPQQHFMAAQKPREELYDCEADPHEVKNLADEPAHAATLERLRAAHESWCDEIDDVGFLPETSLLSFQRRKVRWREESEVKNAVQRIRGLWKIQFDAAWAKSNDPQSIVHELLGVRSSRDFGPGITAVRVRAAEFLGGPWRELPMAADLLLDALRAPELAVRIAAAQSLVELRRSADGSVGTSTFDRVRPIFSEGLRSDNPALRHSSALAVDALGSQAVEFLPEIEAMLKIDKDYAARVGEFIVATRKK
jgi:N-sulfoglucosamine sulfohydrolase